MPYKAQSGWNVYTFQSVSLCDPPLHVSLVKSSLTKSDVKGIVGIPAKWPIKLELILVLVVWSD